MSHTPKTIYCLLLALALGVTTSRSADLFHYPLQLGCINFSSTDPDVTDWQNFLVCMGYMSAATGQFGSTTQMATKQFQIDFQVNAGTGIVDLPTITKAKTQTECPLNITPVSGGCRTH